jgi:hypothetical protein
MDLSCSGKPAVDLGPSSTSHLAQQYYAALRPSEAVALREPCLVLPDSGRAASTWRHPAPRRDLVDRRRCQPATEVARPAGHGLALLLCIYASCIDGQATAANLRIAAALDDAAAAEPLVRLATVTPRRALEPA